MDRPAALPPIVRFGAFELDSKSGELRRHGLKVRLPDQSFHILNVLLSRSGELVTRHDLQEVLWGADTHVDFEVGLNSAVRKLREALDDSAESPRFIETLPRRGYRFIASLTVPPGPPSPPPALPSEKTRTGLSLTWGTALLLLAVMAAGSVRYERAASARASSASRAVHPEAQQLYLKGLTAKGAMRHEAFRRAIAYFEQAIAIQPNFAEAYAELALTQLQFLFTGPLSPRQAVPAAEAWARKAIELDDTLPQAHQALGQARALYHWKWDEADRILEAAASLPGGDVVSGPLTTSLIRRGRVAEAVALAERGRDRDPLSLNAQLTLGAVYRAASRHDRALGEFRRALETSPGLSRAHFQLGVTFVAMGRLDDAIHELEIAARSAQGHNPRFESYLGYAYAAAGRSADARRVLQELDSHRRDQYVSWFGNALVHDALGETLPALIALQRAREDRAVEFGQMWQYPPFRTIATEPAFEAVMLQVGLPPAR